MHRSVVLLAVLFSLTLAASPALAQMGAQHGAMQATHMQQGAMMQTHEMMRNVDQMMTHASSMMHDLAGMQASMQHMAQHNPMATTMQGMLDQMKQMHGQLHDIMKDEMLMKNNEVMKGFHDACKSLEQMAASYQSMARNIMTIMKATQPAGKK